MTGSRAQHLGRVFAAVAELDGHVLGIAHDVRVGQDQAVGADDEARALAAERLLRLAATLALALAIAGNALEELEEGVVLHARRQATAAALRGAFRLLRPSHGDADHGRAELLDDGAVVGHLAAAGDHRHGRGCGGGRQRRHLHVAGRSGAGVLGGLGGLQAGLGPVQQVRAQGEGPGRADGEHAGGDQGGVQGIGLHRIPTSACRGTFRMPQKIGMRG